MQLFFEILFLLIFKILLKLYVFLNNILNINKNSISDKYSVDDLLFCQQYIILLMIYYSVNDILFC